MDEVTLFHPNILEKCYLPPEKIDNEKATLTYKYQVINKEESTLNNLKAMDIFAVGCIFFELFTGDSNPLFTYQKMISYRSGDKSALERLSSIPDENIRSMIAKMVSIDPAERGTFKDHLQVFNTQLPKDMIDLFSFVNYALRRGEFSQPDNKLGLIKMVAPLFIENIKENMSEDERRLTEDKFEGLGFNRCFPYHLSKVAILYQFKGIISSNPIQSLFSNEKLVNFIDKTIADTENCEFKIPSANPSSSIYLDGVGYLKESKLLLDQKPFKEADPYAEKTETSQYSLEELFKKQLSEAKMTKVQYRVLKRFTAVSSLIETICSLVRNLQLSQSYLVALELLENFSRFTKSEEVIFIIFPHLQSQVEAQSNKIEKYYSIDLFCKLVNRIRYVPPSLSKPMAYSGYIRTMIDLCKGDPFLQNQIFKNIRSFIYLNILFSVLSLQYKLEEKMGKSDPEFVLGTVDSLVISRVTLTKSALRCLVTLQ